jgi:SPP1 family predicted phage head-tail adaptor
MGTWPYPWLKNKNPFAIPPGSLRNQIAVQQKSNTVTGTGSPLASWTTILTCMAAINTTAEREVYQTGQFSGQVTHRVSIYWPGVSIPITAGMQVLFGTRVFTIQAVDNVQERNRVLHLMCLEINGVQ